MKTLAQFFVFLALTSVILTSTPSEAKVYESRYEWTMGWEKMYRKWVENFYLRIYVEDLNPFYADQTQGGDEPDSLYLTNNLTEEMWDGLSPEGQKRLMESLSRYLMQDRENPFKGLKPDCADNAYIVRAIFAYIYRLPFCFRGGMYGLTCVNKDLTKWDYLGGTESERLLAFLNDLAEPDGTVSTTSLTHDTFLVRVDDIRPGDAYRFDYPNRQIPLHFWGKHTHMVKGIDQYGIQHYFWATVPGGARTLDETRDNPVHVPSMSLQSGFFSDGGFRRFRWPEDYKTPRGCSASMAARGCLIDGPGSQKELYRNALADMDHKNVNKEINENSYNIASSEVQAEFDAKQYPTDPAWTSADAPYEGMTASQIFDAMVAAKMAAQRGVYRAYFENSNVNSVFADKIQNALCMREARERVREEARRTGQPEAEAVCKKENAQVWVSRRLGNLCKYAQMRVDYVLFGLHHRSKRVNSAAEQNYETQLMNLLNKHWQGQQVAGTVHEMGQKRSNPIGCMSKGQIDDFSTYSRDSTMAKLFEVLALDWKRHLQDNEFVEAVGVIWQRHINTILFANLQEARNMVLPVWSDRILTLSTGEKLPEWEFQLRNFCAITYPIAGHGVTLPPREDQEGPLDIGPEATYRTVTLRDMYLRVMSNSMSPDPHDPAIFRFGELNRQLPFEVEPGKPYLNCR